ncbi:hypothetical protein [Kineococcus sp. SYSU DK003]|uniref:hypothetical protein n=1 Tax=Kineococcus sp. SYSU DK003 TaxID=3383124 RepID=UPI003D7D7401
MDLRGPRRGAGDLGGTALAPGGLLLLVEGSWETGAGIGARDCEHLVRRHRAEARVRTLDDPALWGREIRDERYLLLSRS